MQVKITPNKIQTDNTWHAPIQFEQLPASEKNAVEANPDALYVLDSNGVAYGLWEFSPLSQDKTWHASYPLGSFGRVVIRWNKDCDKYKIAIETWIN